MSTQLTFFASKYDNLTNPIYVTSNVIPSNVQIGYPNTAVVVDLVSLQKQSFNFKINVARNTSVERQS